MLDEVQDLANEMNNAVADAEKNRRRRDLRQKRQGTTTTINIEVIVKISVEITSWLVDIERITDSDREFIQSTTTAVKQIRSEIQAGSTLSVSAIKIIKTTTKKSVRLASKLIRVVEREEKQEQLSVKKELITKVQQSVTEIQSSMSTLQQSLAQAGSAGAGGITSSASVIENISIILKAIIKSGLGAITSTSAASLATFEAELQALLSQVQSGTVTFTSEEITLVETTQSQITTATTKITAAQEKNKAMESSQTQAVLLDSLSTATSIVKEQIDLLTSAMNSVTEGTASVSVTITTTLITLLINLQTSIESVTEAQIQEIKAFEEEARSILQNEAFTITNFPQLVSANNKLSAIVNTKIEETLSRAAISESLDIFYEVSFFVFSLVEIAEEIQTITSSSTSTQSNTIITNTLTFIQNIKINSLTTEDVTKLESLYDDMSTLVDSVDSSVGFTGIDDIINEGSQIDIKLFERIDEYESKEETITVITLFEKMSTIASSTEKATALLKSKVSSSSSSVIDASLEAVIQDLQVLMDKFSSKTYAPNDVDILQAENSLAMFESKVESVSVIKGSAALDKLITTTKKAVSTTAKSLSTLQESAKNKEKIEILLGAEYIVSEIYFVIQGLSSGIDEGDILESNIFIEDIQTELNRWSASITNIKLSSVSIMEGLLETISDLSGAYAGIDTLLQTLTSVQTRLGEQITTIEEADANGDLTVKIYNALDIIVYVIDLLKELNQLTAGGTVVTESSAVSNIVTTITSLSKSVTNISSDDMETLEANLITLEEFVLDFEVGSDIQIADLVQAITEVSRVEQIFVREVNKIELSFSKLSIYETILITIIDINSYLQELFDINSGVEEGSDVQKNFVLDEYYEVISFLIGKVSSLTEADINTLNVFLDEISSVAVEADGTLIISGYIYSIQQISQQVTMFTEKIDETIETEQEQQNLVQNLIFGDDLLSILIRIFFAFESMELITTVSTTTQFNTENFVAAMTQISNNVTSVSIQDIDAFAFQLEKIIAANERLENFEELKLVTKQAEDSVQTYLSESREIYEITINIRHASAVIEAVDTLLVDSMTFIQNAEASKLIGENDPDVDFLIDFFKRISANVDSVTEEDIFEATEIFLTIQATLDMLGPDEGIGNLVDFMAAAQEAIDSANRRLYEQQDRFLLIEELGSFELILNVVSQITYEVVEIISMIGTITSVGEENELVTSIVILLESLSSSPSSTIDTVLLESMLEDLEVLKSSVTAGVEIPSIFYLQSVSQKAMSVLQSEIQFRVSAQEAQSQIDQLTQSVTSLNIIEEELVFALEFFGSTEQSESTTMPFIIEDLNYVLNTILFGELTADLAGDLEFFQEEIFFLYDEDEVDVSMIANTLETLTSVKRRIETSLKDTRRISEERSTASRLNKAKKIVSEMEEIFDTFVSEIGNANEEIEIAEIADVTNIFTDINTGVIISLDIVIRLEEILILLKNTTVSTGMGIIGLEDARTLVVLVQETVEMEISHIQISIDRAVKTVTFNKGSSLLRRIIHTASELSIGYELATSEERDETVDELIVFIESLSIESLTMEQIIILQESTLMFEELSETGTAIAGLRKLQSIASVRLEEATNSKNVLSGLSEESESLKALDRTEAVLLKIQETLLNISASINEDNEPVDRMMELSDILMMDIMMLTESVIRLEEIYKNIEIIGATFVGSLEMTEEIISSITFTVTSISIERAHLESRIERLALTETLLDAGSLFIKISDVLENITAEIGDETQESEENELIKMFGEELSTLSLSVVSLRRDTLLFFEDVLQELEMILMRKTNVKGILKVMNELRVVSSKIALEIEASQAEQRREVSLMINRRAEESVASALDLFTDLSDFIGIPDVDAEPVEILEVERILMILSIIEDGQASEEDLDQLGRYLMTLEFKFGIFEDGMMIRNLMEVIMTSQDLIDTLMVRTIDSAFDVEYSQHIFTQKQIQALLSRVIIQLEVLHKTGNGIPVAIFESLSMLIEKAGSEDSFEFVTSFEMAVTELMELNVTNTDDTVVMTRLNLLQRARSVEFSLSQKISRSYVIETTTAQVFSLEESLSLLEKMMRSVKQVKNSMNPDGTSVNILALGEIILFIQNTFEFTAGEIALLREYEHILMLLEEEAGDMFIEGLDELMFELKYQVSHVSMTLAEVQRTQMLEKQIIYTTAGNEVITEAYNKISIFGRPMSGEIIQVNEVTSFSLMLNAVDLTSITPVEIHHIHTRFENLMEIIAIETSEIAYLPRIVNQLALLTYKTSQHLQFQESLENIRIVSGAFESSRAAITTASTALFALQEEVGAVTTYETNDMITQLYEYLLFLTFDWRLIPADFSEVVESFGISEITVTSGTSFAYLKETIDLLELYSHVDMQTEETLHISESILQAKEVQSSVSLFMRSIEDYLFGYMVEDFEDDNSDDGGDGGDDESEGGDGGDGEGTEDNDGGAGDDGGDDGDNGNDVDAGDEGDGNDGEDDVDDGNDVGDDGDDGDDGNGGEEDDSENDVDEDEEDKYEEDAVISFNMIIDIVMSWSEGDIDFHGHDAMGIKKHVSMFLKGNTNIVFSKFQRQFLIESMSIITSAAANINKRVQAMESSASFQMSYSRIEEVNSIFMSIEDMLFVIRESEKITVETEHVLGSLTEWLMLFTDVHSIKDEDISILRSYAFDLSALSTNKSGDVNVDLTTVSSKLDMAKETVWSAIARQSSLVVENEFKDRLMSSQIEEARQVSQMDYILEEIEFLLSMIEHGLVNLHDLVESDGPADVESEATGEGNGDMEEGNSEDKLTAISLMLRVILVDTDNIQSNNLRDLASSMSVIEMLLNNTAVFVNLTVLEDLETLVMETQDKINTTRELISSYARGSNDVMTYLELSSIVGKTIHAIEDWVVTSDSMSEDKIFNGTEMTSFNIFTDLLINLNLMRSSIDMYSVYEFKTSFMELQNLHEIIPTTDMQLWYHFVLEYKSTLEDILFENLENALLDSVSLREQYQYMRASNVLSHLMQSVDILIDSLDGSESSSNSSLSDRLLRIVRDATSTARQWSMGMVEMYQIMSYEELVQELMDIGQVLEESDPIPELDELKHLLLNAMDSISFTLERLEKDVFEDMAYADIRAYYQFFSVFGAFLANQDLLMFNMTINTTLLEDMDGLLMMLEVGHVDPLDINLEVVQEKVLLFIGSGFISSDDNNTDIEYYEELVSVVGDIVQKLEFLLRKSIWMRMIRTVSDISHLILDDEPNARELTYVGDVQDINMKVMRAKNTLYTVSRNAIMELSSMTTLFRWLIHQHGNGMVGLSTMRINLAYITLTSMRYIHYAEMHYSYGRASRILHHATYDMEELQYSLEHLMMDIGEITETDFADEESVTDAYHFILNISSNAHMLPTDLGEILGSYNFSSIQVTEGTGIQHLLELSHLVRELLAMEHSITRTLRYLEEADAMIRTKDAVFSVNEALMTKAQDFSDFEFYDYFKDASNETTISPSTMTEATVTSLPTTTANISEEFIDDEMNVFEIIEEIMNITEALYYNSSFLTGEEVDRLMKYADFLRHVPRRDIEMIEDFSYVQSKLSDLLAKLLIISQGAEAAIMVSESHAMLEKVRIMGEVLHSSLKNMEGQGSDDTEVLIDEIARCYEDFSMGFFFITEEEVYACRKLIYDFSSSIIGSESVDSSDLEVHMAEAMAVVDETAGFVSALLYHYEKLQHMEKDMYDISIKEQEHMLALKSQIMYGYESLELMLDSIAHNLSRLLENEGDVSDTLPVLPELSTILYSIFSKELLQIDLHHVAYIAKEIRTFAEDGISVNATSVMQVTDLIDEFFHTIGPIIKSLHPSGKESTRYIVLQYARHFMEGVAARTQEWADIINGINDLSNISFSTFTPSVTTTTVSSASTSTFSPMSGNITDVVDLINMKFMDGSDILMEWTFDREAINIMSIMAFRHLMKDLQDVFMPSEGQELEGFHIWQYSLLDSNTTLLERLEYLTEDARQMALLRSIIFDYSAASRSLHYYENVLENDHNESWNDTHPGNDMADNDDDEDVMDDDQEELRGDSKEDEHMIKVIDKLHHLSSAIMFIMRRWEMSFDRTWNEIVSLESHISILEELKLAEERLLHPMIVDDLRMMAEGGSRATFETLDALWEYAHDAYNVSAYMMHIRFFEELKQFIEYSIEFIEMAKLEFEMGPFDNVTASSSSYSSTSASSTESDTSTTTETITTTAAFTTPNVSLSLNDTHECEDIRDLLCTSERLVTALREAYYGNSSEDDMETTTEYTTTEMATRATNVSNDDDMYFEDRMMDMFEFEYEEVRMRVYDFWRVIAKHDFTAEDMFDEAVMFLEDGLEIVNAFIDRLSVEEESIEFLPFEDFISTMNQTSPMMD